MHKKIRETILLFLLIFVLLLAFWDSWVFGSDEVEIFYKGFCIAKGLPLYKDVISQHMPLSYLAAALFAKLGIRSVFGFRLAFYLLLAAFYALLFFFYSEKFGRLTLVVYPITMLFLLSMSTYAKSIVCEHFVGIGFAFLFFELLCYTPGVKLSLGAIARISLGIFLAFANAFVSVFAIFIVFVTVLATELRYAWQQKPGTGKVCRDFLGRFLPLFCGIVLPFAALLLYFAVHGTLQNFYECAYVLNREIYPKYMSGYGNSALAAFFQGFLHLWRFLKDFVPSSRIFAELIFLLLFLIANYLYARKRKDAILGVGIFLFFETAATRGIYNFHGIPALAVMAAMISIFLGEYGKTIKTMLAPAGAEKIIADEQTRSSRAVPLARLTLSGTKVAATAVLFAVFLLASPYLAVMPHMFSWMGAEAEEDRTLEVLRILTEPGERVGSALLTCGYQLDAEVLPATAVTGSTPWTWEWGGAEAMSQLRANPPKVYLFNPEQETFHKKIDSYAPELVAFIEGNYQSLAGDGAAWVYVRNDLYVSYKARLG